jgi:nucleoid-associated protein EbfC
MTDQHPDQPEDAGLPDLGGLVGGLLGGGGPGGLGDLLAQAQQAMSASQAAAGQEVEGSAGGGVVRIRTTGAGEVLSVHIDPAVVDPDDVEGLEDLVLAALRDAQAAAARLHEQAMGGFDPSSMLGGLLGGGEDE